MSLRDDYDIPKGTTRLPALRMWAVMLVFPVAALVLWLVLPNSPITVAILALAILVAVGLGVFWVMSARGLNRPPGRNPQPRP
jgi:predicted neutral ceramidase superfamily lipid hydrolase